MFARRKKLGLQQIGAAPSGGAVSAGAFHAIEAKKTTAAGCGGWAEKIRLFI
jgi:hypothetical protein